MMRRSVLVIFVLSMIGVISCQRKVILEPGHTHGVPIHIKALADFGEKLPASTAFIFYPIERGRKNSYIVKGIEDTIYVVPGKYHILSYTSDFNELDANFYRGLEDFNTAESHTKKSSRPSGAGMEEPDPLFSALLTNWELKQKGDSIRIELDKRSYLYWFYIEVEGLQYIHSAHLDIGGMYSSVFLADGKNRTDDHGFIRVDTEVRSDENELFGQFYSFGPHQEAYIKNTMIVTFVNGRTFYLVLDDISDEIKKLTKGGEIRIKQKLIINVDDTGTGFVPGLEDWDDEENVDIPI